MRLSGRNLALANALRVPGELLDVEALALGIEAFIAYARENLRYVEPH